jgi:general secretion pathway protein D
LSDPVATPVAPPPPPPQDPNNPTPLPLPDASAIKPAPTLNVATPPSTPLIPNPPSTFTISKESGIVNVFASERQHKLVKKFLDTYRRVTMSQVLIEARVLEVTLTDEFATGIEWGKINLSGLVSANINFAAPSPASAGAFTANLDLGHLLNPMLKALSKYGTVRALSSPRVTVMNNQPAVVNVTRNRVYFTITTVQTPATVAGGAPLVTSTSTPQSAPEGVLLNVLPTANPDTGEVILAVRPTVSKITGQIQDPLNAGNTVPELSVQEIDSIIKMQSGQTMVMGGLMKDQNVIDQSGVPILGDVPVVGALFRNHGDTIQKSELVILLQATIVPGTNVDNMDRKMYKQYGQDRRPVRL